MQTKDHTLTRRQFLGTSMALAGTGLLGPLAAAPARRTAVDQVPLGQTGLRCCRLGFGTGPNGGQVQRTLGRETFERLVRYAYDQGITYLDCAQNYATFEWVGGAIRGLPRERLFLLSKVPGQPQDVLATIDRHRKVFDTDYIDCLLIHCMVRAGWPEQWKRVMDAFDEAQSRKWIRSKGVSCHSLPALRDAVASDWPQVHLVRVNPQAKHIDGPEEAWNRPGNDLAPVMEQLKAMRAKGRGVIGMKILANGDFTQAEDREKSIRFALSRPEIDVIVIGFKNTAEIDEALQRMNRALAEA